MATVMIRAHNSQIISPARPPTNSRPIVSMLGSDECSAGRTLTDFITATSFGDATICVGRFDGDWANPNCWCSRRSAIGVGPHQLTTSLERWANILRLSKSETLTIAAAEL